MTQHPWLRAWEAIALLLSCLDASETHEPLDAKGPKLPKSRLMSRGDAKGPKLPKSRQMSRGVLMRTNVS